MSQLLLAIRFFVYRGETLHFLIFLISSSVCVCVRACVCVSVCLCACVCLDMTSISREAASHLPCHCLRVALIQPVDRCKMFCIAIMTWRLLLLFSISFYCFLHCRPFLPPLSLTALLSYPVPSLLIFILLLLISLRCEWSWSAGYLGVDVCRWPDVGVFNSESTLLWVL